MTKRSPRTAAAGRARFLRHGGGRASAASTFSSCRLLAARSVAAAIFVCAGSLRGASYAEYKTIHFGPDIKRSAAAWSDANGDGVSNLLDFAFGRSPLEPPASVPWALSLQPTQHGGRQLVLSYPRDAEAQVDLAAEASSSLSPEDWSAADVEIISPKTPGSSYRAVLPLNGSAGASFLRLRASLPDGVPAAKGDGYRGIWYTLGQPSAYGDKYSGGLGTYTSSHSPTAIYAPEANKTFFTYGGTPSENQRQLQIMVAFFDHRTGLVSRPTKVYSRNLVDDPHDNASLAIDEEGHVWLFVSGRGTIREGRIFRSGAPFSIASFDLVRSGNFTYPQPRWFEGRGFIHLFTKYIGSGRHLFWSTSRNGDIWSEDHPLAEIEGHYQISGRHGDRVGSAFNRHPGGNADRRTDLFYLQTDDLGQTWKTASGIAVATPVTTATSPALVRNYSAAGRLVYLQDIAFDAQGRPAILYLTSSHFQPGPAGSPRAWEIAHWQDTHWVFRQVTTSTHNYDVGFLRIEADGLWRIFGPTETGPQPWGTGGEIALWESSDEGATWRKVRKLTGGSIRNHGYVRTPLNAHPDFYAFWADGNTDSLSRSYLYFSNRGGDKVFRLPYDMNTDAAAPEAMPVPPLAIP